MKRAALLIGGIGSDGASTRTDLLNYKAFLKSAAGGSWFPHEITDLHLPSAQLLKVFVAMLGTADYSFIAFAGSGERHKGRLWVKLNPHAMVPAGLFLLGACRHTAIVDCCRLAPVLTVMEKAAELVAPLRPGVVAADARRAFDQALEQCPPGAVTVYSCTAGEIVQEPVRNGAYSYSLVEGAKTWVRRSRVGGSGSGVPRFLSVADAHDQALDSVLRASRYSQFPRIDKPPEGPYFPFAMA